MPQQLTRLLLIFAVLASGLALARHLLLPETFGERGYYRTAAVEGILKQPIMYAGRERCALCHTQIATAHANARHQSVACEACHGPAAAHTEAPTDNPLPVPRERGYCSLCHGYDPSRPTGFPQIDPVAHNPLQACVSCHNPHQPEPPHIPEECSVCHGAIARTKAVSVHVLLPCTRCHTTPRKHKITPRVARADKPQSREFCGSCHAVDARGPKETPRVDLETHHRRYLCWQCHDPHHPRELD